MPEDPRLGSGCTSSSFLLVKLLIERLIALRSLLLGSPTIAAREFVSSLDVVAISHLTGLHRQQRRLYTGHQAPRSVVVH